MGKQFRELTEEQIHFIQNQHIFFITTAPSGDGRINLSPKGYDSLKVVNNHTLSYVDFAGSGNETANHLLDNPRITFMWCSFEQKPLILRAYGYGKVIKKYTDEYFTLMEDYYAHIPSESARQIFVVDIESVQTSCGFAIPLMEYVDDRETLSAWTKNKTSQGKLDEYIKKHEPRLDEKYPLNK
ncbi:pyridoxamine 5'-phosphate oxidase family protein [Cytobacillus sp. IB215665]|uniref:pyridoxamine 5'-phosphate oxidase family protein n=1 Tax=Cytobacillus sp. IB215665 TaxID=3097357 RepID=UPI002A0D94EA|nr:pyridoxamine 5'-phosphate oxidase family protein [Cytobacillus sp. IB215665]MDX8365295.1 pyridoxamine 5'-phosphate oxidase family protein [Cytobacillus sp. IB215665]